MALNLTSTIHGHGNASSRSVVGSSMIEHAGRRSANPARPGPLSALESRGPDLRARRGPSARSRHATLGHGSSRPATIPAGEGPHHETRPARAGPALGSERRPNRLHGALARPERRVITERGGVHRPIETRTMMHCAQTPRINRRQKRTNTGSAPLRPVLEADMRTVLSTIVILLLSAQAGSAETWVSRESTCLEWSGLWNVQEDRDGMWNGTVDYIHIGGSCDIGTSEYIAGEVTAILAGRAFFAVRQSRRPASFCSYYGTRRGDKVTGSKLCEGSAVAFPFALRLNYRERPGPRRRGEFGLDDEWLNSLSRREERRQSNDDDEISHDPRAFPPRHRRP